MTDITELAQRNELLIANGQQTADLLRHLADNEIDSDYFAVVSECESYGKETDAELSITEFALRAAGYVDALVAWLNDAYLARGVVDGEAGSEDARPGYIPVYREAGPQPAPLVPVVPDFKKLARELVDNLVDCGGLDEGVKEKYLEWAEKTCRAAMLAAAPQEAQVVPEKIEQSRKRVDRCDVYTEGARGGCGTCIFNGNFE